MTLQSSNKQFVDDLFDKLFSHVDTDMIDLHDDDTCCDHLEFEQLTIDFWTMTISEVMLDRWLLEQLDSIDDDMATDIEKDMPREELSYEVLELLS